LRKQRNKHLDGHIFYFKETGECDFVVHFSIDVFNVITSDVRSILITERVQSRLTQSMDYFYPLRDREPESPPGNAERLSLTLKGINAAQGSFEDLKSLKAVIQRIIG
jgi:hypothetical protein